jgi:hypothetical protein
VSEPIPILPIHLSLRNRTFAVRALALAAAGACLWAARARAQHDERLPGLTARAARGDCTARDDPRARALWTRLRERYSRAGDTVSLWTVEMASTAGEVPAERLLRFDTAASDRPDGTTTGWDAQEVRRDGLRRILQFYAAPRTGRGGRGMSGIYRAVLEAQIADSGYARLMSGVNADITGASAAWAYPPLEAELATHFVGDEFGRRNDLSLTTVDGREAIEFCAARRFRSRPYVSGVLVPRADGTLERAWWRFRTPAPDEQAGGEVEFAAYDASAGLPLLLAARGRFYRRQGTAAFYQREQTFAAWETAAREAIPTAALAQARRKIARPVPHLGRSISGNP